MSAILELAKGERVVRVTIAGKSTEFGQSDLPALRALRDELGAEYMGLVSASNHRVFRAKTSKGL